MKNLLKNICSNKKLLSVLFITCCFITCICAQTTTTTTTESYDFGMNGVMTVVIKFLTSNWIIGIVIALLAFEIILLITAGRSDNQAWKKFVPIILGTGLFLAAPKIAGYFIKSSDLTTTQDTALKAMGVKS